jgi:hypothetical protein
LPRTSAYARNALGRSVQPGHRIGVSQLRFERSASIPSLVIRVVLAIRYVLGIGPYHHPVYGTRRAEIVHRLPN